jgi:hypothetical protein
MNNPVLGLEVLVEPEKAAEEQISIVLETESVETFTESLENVLQTEIVNDIIQEQITEIREVGQQKFKTKVEKL